MPKYSKENRERRIAEWESKIMAAMKEHTALHYTELNELLGKHRDTKPYKKGHYEEALAWLIYNGKIVEVSHHARSPKYPRRGTGAAQIAIYYSLPAYAEVASWAKFGRRGIHPNVKALLEMDKIASEHPKGWIHYRRHKIRPDFLRAKLIKKRVYNPHMQPKKDKKYYWDMRYVRTRKFNTAVRVLKKVLDHRGIPY